METSSRMRRCLRWNYRGSDHLGAAANYEDEVERNPDKEKVPVLAAEAILMDGINEDDEHPEADNLDGRAYSIEQHGENQPRLLVTNENLQPSAEISDAPLAGDQNLERTSAVAPGYVPSDLDDIIVFELPSSMVRPLRVIRGTFQVTTRRINFIVETTENSAVDGIKSCNSKDREKDRSWLISSLHQIYSQSTQFSLGFFQITIQRLWTFLILRLTEIFPSLLVH